MTDVVAGHREERSCQSEDRCWERDSGPTREHPPLGSDPRSFDGRLRRYAVIKRSLDVFVSLTASVLLLPAIATVALTVRWFLGRPVLFVQQRAGQGGRAFELYKFRTMKNAFDIHGNPLPDECRVHAWGNFLRKWSLDELPQLWNVLRGDMSLVGPRPLLVRYVERYSDYQRRRLEALPGLTGWAQINGRNALSWNEKFELDVWYVDRASLKLDLLILWRTFSSVFRPRGIRAAQHATMPEFLGNSSTENATPQLSNSFSTEKQSAI